MKSASKPKNQMLNREGAKTANKIFDFVYFSSILSLRSSRLRGEMGLGCLLLLFLSLGTVWGASPDDLFSVVPLKDATYSRLEDLAKAGLLPASDAEAPLTRYDVVQRILKAHRKYDEIVVAQADMEIPPPPADGQTAPASSSDELQAPGSEKASSQATPDESPAGLAKAAQSLHSLDEAYQYELKSVKDRLKAVQDRVASVDADQYDLRKRIMGIEQFPTVAVHGVGRASLYSNQYDTASMGVSLPYPGSRLIFTFLDLEPEGIVSKEISWNTNIRLATNFLSNPNNELLTVRRVSMNFNPSWLSATVGDFDEGYTPFTLWNRNSEDLAYKPEAYARQDDWNKYESFLNNEPNWPFRGVKLGTAVMWPDSEIMDELHGSVFANMIRNGFNVNGGWFYGPNQFTDWIFGGTGGLKSKKWYLGGTSVQLGVNTYGIILDEPLDTQTPGSPYGQFNPTTWAHQYVIGSVRPDLKVGIGDDVYIGGAMEYAFTSFQDDKLDNAKVSKDFALNVGPYIQMGDSKITLNYLNVGPYFYSPLAQTRQDAVTSLSGSSVGVPLRSQYFLQDVPRAGGIYTYYDRTQDNTFPYGLATPNRQGLGGELDVKTLKEQALKIKGSAYFVQEISGNLVVNGSGTGFVPVDGQAGTTIVPIRNFTYLNVGPSLNLGPLMGLGRDLEVGTNVRLEQTTSVLGTLTTTWLIGAIKAGVLPIWDIEASFSEQDINGTDAGIGGFSWARYSYIYDNTDLGSYTTFTVNGNSQVLLLSSVLKINRNSSLYLDYEWYQANDLWNTTTRVKLIDNIAELTYEVQF